MLFMPSSKPLDIASLLSPARASPRLYFNIFSRKTSSSLVASFFVFCKLFNRSCAVIVFSTFVVISPVVLFSSSNTRSLSALDSCSSPPPSFIIFCASSLFTSICFFVAAALIASKSVKSISSAPLTSYCFNISATATLRSAFLTSSLLII